MKKYSDGNFLSARETALIDKEICKQQESDIKMQTPAECGLKNICTFGVHNPNFDHGAWSKANR